ncbi:alpha-1,2-fucosyltransferase [Pelomonas sp. SE-A7]|uniref:alpha-1,2-fucosyltransferase n=1 Tax=Pelomonas sp. SE-A7 TaxID=3054953 RepID=UPI00259CC004|nr:alpha-1,2-fucosyltransferase [Pelomonas sp. SE-A7]MDM4764972.1 alpha-1,2-fucosyltransferase [Pelomonas sp. SE-A7]
MSAKPVVLNYAKGGLGNQLFQHVFARSLARRLGVEMLTDISYFGHDPYGFKAGIWNLQPGARSGLLSELAGPGAYALKEGQIQSVEQVQQLPPDARVLVLEGYWQSERFFDADIARETHAQLAAQVAPTVDSALLERLRSSPAAVAVHLRRRDYGHMGLCRPAYYAAALQLIAQAHPGLELFVFTDEPNYSRHLLNQLGYRYQMVASGDDRSDLYLMSLCRHFVISNSSYSWWAAWFGEPQGGSIFCPQEWVTIDATLSPCPPRWQALRGAVQAFDLPLREVEALMATAGSRAGAA